MRLIVLVPLVARLYAVEVSRLPQARDVLRLDFARGEHLLLVVGEASRSFPRAQFVAGLIYIALHNSRGVLSSQPIRSFGVLSQFLRAPLQDDELALQ